jgi:hypothetical protein
MVPYANYLFELGKAGKLSLTAPEAGSGAVREFPRNVLVQELALQKPGRQANPAKSWRRISPA